MHLKGPADNHIIRLCRIWNCALRWTFLNVCSVPQQARCVYRFLYPLRTASWWDLGYVREWHSHDAGPMRHSVSVSHSGIQYSGFPLQWLQKYRWAHSRWTCHSQHLQHPNSQQGKTEGQRKFCCEVFCWATWEAWLWRWNTILSEKQHTSETNCYRMPLFDVTAQCCMLFVRQL